MLLETAKTPIAVGAIALLPVCLTVVACRLWVLLRHGGFSRFVCVAGPFVLGGGLSWQFGHPLFGTTVAFAVGLLLLAAVRPDVRRVFSSFAEGLIVCACVCSALGAVAGSLMGGWEGYGAYVGLVAALGFALIALTDGLQAQTAARVPGAAPGAGKPAIGSHQ